MEEWERYLPEELKAELQNLPKGLLDHCARASEVCHTLAGRFGYDPAKAKATAMSHDVARAMSGNQLLRMANQYGLYPSEVEEALPILLHGPVGAEHLRRNYGLADDEMLAAIACHTTGRQNMGLLDKLLFLADKIEPEKVQFRLELEEVVKLSEKNLDRALLKFFDLQLAYLIGKGLLIHPAMVGARNGILLACKGRG